MNCPRCGKENPDANLFCGKCGLEFASVASAPPAEEVRYCYRHPKQPTNLACGRCGRPICHRCVVIGPAGPRCRECAKHKVPVTARAIAGEAKIGLRRLFWTGPQSFFYYAVLISLILSLFRGCAYLREEPAGREVPREQADSRQSDE